MRIKVVLFLVTFAVWCCLSWKPDWQHLLIGVFLAGFVTFLNAPFFAGRPRLLNHPARISRFLFLYLPLFLWEVVKANIDVAYRVLSPSLPIRPGIVRIRTSLSSDAGLTFLANSITLTPGTMSVDVDPERKVIYVHCINVKSAGVEEVSLTTASRFETILRGIFEEDGKR